MLKAITMDRMPIYDMIQNMEDNGGATLKGYKPVSYKTGYQVGIVGYETSDPDQAYSIIEKYNGSCGLWFSDGIYYIDYSIRVSGKLAAILTGKAYNQKSIYDWKNDKLIFLDDISTPDDR